MPKNRIDDAVTKVLALRDNPDASALREALSHKSARVVLAAAQVIEGLEQTAGWPELSAAFIRVLDEPEAHKHDPMCRAKVGLLKAMLKREADSEREAYLRGRGYVQNEPAYGGSNDTAGEVRALSVLGLVRTRHPDATVLAAEALADPQRGTRIGAAQALGEAVPDHVLPLLRYKLAVGDKDPEVTGAVFASFLDLAPALALELAPALMHGDDAETIALALGESKRREAFPVLRDAADRLPEVAYVAMALLRDEEATALLLETVANGRASHAEHALKALAHFRHDPKLRARALEAVEQRGDKKLAATAASALAV
jgi:hypothetical protein